MSNANSNAIYWFSEKMAKKYGKGNTGKWTSLEQSQFTHLMNEG
jgi:hypothetical protein